MKTKPVIIAVLAILSFILCEVHTTYAGPTAAITLSASPLSVPADGVSSIAITATMLDSSGRPVDIGTSADFATISGPGLFSNGTTTITELTLVGSGNTGAGIIVVSLMSDNTSGTSQIRCDSNGVTQYITVSFDATGSITLTASPQWIPADGQSSSALTATVINSAGAPAAVGTEVTFSIESGSPSGTTLSDGFNPPASPVTVQVSNSAGSATVSLIAGSTPGIVKIKCTSNFMTQYINVAIGVGSITLTATPTSIPADGISSSVIKAVIMNSQGVAVSAGTSVTFSTSLGTFSNGLNTIALGTVDATGIVSTSLIAGLTAGTAQVTCSSNGVTQSVSVSIGTFPIAAITLTANPASLPADGASSTNITASVIDVTGSPLNLNGVKLTFTTTLGHFSNNLQTIEVLSQKGILTGQVVVSLIAGTTSGVALITCESGGVTQATVVTIGTSGQVASITLSSNPTSLPADGASSSTITAQLLDTSGSLISLTNIPVTFTTTLGHFSNNSQTITVTSQNTTFVAGKVVVSLIAGTTSGVALIKCESGGVTQTTNVTIGTSGQVASITLSSNPTSLPADGASSSTITAQLLDTSGSLISLSNIPVTFTTTLGHFSNNSQTITVTSQSTAAVPGKVVVSLIAGTTSGTAVITCESSGVSQATTINIGSATTVASITLTASPSSFEADTTTFSTITATLYTTNGQPVSSGVVVSFATNRGFFSNNQQTIIGYTNSSGVAVAYLFSGGAVGTAEISASAGGINRYVYVSFTAPPTPKVDPYLNSFVLFADPQAVKIVDAVPSTISAQLYDQYGQVFSFPNISVVFTTTPTGLAHFSNNLTTITVSTNASGVATALLYSSVVGTAAVNANVGYLTTNPVFVNFIGPGTTADIVLTADPVSNPADNQSVSKITAILYDLNGNTETSGIKVTFKTSLGRFSNNDASIDAYTDSKGVATAYLTSGTIGAALISASSNGVTRYVTVLFTGVGPPAYISLSASPNWIPADGYTYTTITATIQDSAGQPVVAGTSVTFTTTLGVFENGKTTYQVATPDNTGTVKVHLRATSTIAIGTAVITCTSGSASQSLTVRIVQLEYETEPNNDMAHADVICFNNVYLAQLFSPYEEDWYTFTIITPSRIGINFITTAIPAIAGTCTGTTTTVGTYRVDIRDEDNNVLMSYQNVDCSLDNGIWETGVVPSGKYYIVVFCPRLPDNSHYLSSSYYLSVFDNFYLPCGNSDRLVNSASLSQEASTYQLHVPIIDTTPYIWADLQYYPIPGTSLMFRLSDCGLLTNLDNYRYCNQSNLSQVDGNYLLHIPEVIYNGVSYRVDLTYVPTTDGQIWFMLSAVWLN